MPSKYKQQHQKSKQQHPVLINKDGSRDASCKLHLTY